MDYNDQELLDYINSGNEEALEIIYKKYEPFIDSKAKRYLKVNDRLGIDLNDLLQEGRLALNEAIKGFNSSMDTTFYTYATTCIERRMISFLISSNRLKHKILNESIPFEQDDDSSSYSLENIIINDDNDPLNIVISNEREENFFIKIKQELTDFEYQVFELKYHNFNYKEISEILEKDSKAIDNAIQRIRIKTKKILKEEK